MPIIRGGFAIHSEAIALPVIPDEEEQGYNIIEIGNEAIDKTQLTALGVFGAQPISTKESFKLQGVVPGATVTLRYGLSGKALAPDKTINLSNVQMKKILAEENRTINFTYQNNPFLLSDGQWYLGTFNPFVPLHSSYPIFGGDQNYLVYFAIKDGGAFDADGTENGVIVDPNILVLPDSTSNPSNPSSPSNPTNPTSPPDSTPDTTPEGQQVVEIDESTDTPVVKVSIHQKDIIVDDTGTEETATVLSSSIIASVEALEKAVAAGEASGNDSTVEVVIPAPAGTAVAIEKVKVEISVGDLVTLAASDAVENIKIVSSVGDIKLNTTALNELVSKAQSAGSATNVGIVIAQGAAKVEELFDGSGASDEVYKKRLDEKLKDGKTREVFDVSVYAGNTRIDEFNVTGKLTIGLPYALKSGEVSSNVWVEYMDIANDTAKRMESGRAYRENKAIFETNHLSIYAVVYDAKTASSPSTASGGGGCDAGFGVFALLAAVGAAVIRKR
jgi:Synergist-CTERM protein sorting domain-containing protein